MLPKARRNRILQEPNEPGGLITLRAQAQRNARSKTVDPTQDPRGSRTLRRGPRSVSGGSPAFPQLLADLAGAVTRLLAANRELADARAGIRNLIYDTRMAAGLSYRALAVVSATHPMFIKRLETGAYWSEPAVERILSAFVRLAEKRPIPHRLAKMGD